MLFGYVLAGRLLKPLRQMMQVTRKVADGDYSATVPVGSHDEIGELAASFNRMTGSLQQLEALRKTMMTDVAHELRSPLSNMRGYLEALRDDVVPPTRATFDSLHEETMRLTPLVDDLLQLSNADAAAPGIRLVPLSIARQITAVCELFRGQASGKGAGIGLAIVKELVVAHHGRVGAASVPGGNRVWFELPSR